MVRNDINVEILFLSDDPILLLFLLMSFKITRLSPRQYFEIEEPMLVGKDSGTVFTIFRG